MADNAARAFAIAQLIVGFLLFCSGIGEQVVGKLISKRLYVGIVAGIWVLITGCLGIPGSREEPTEGSNGYATAFRCFSVFSALLGGGLVGLYSAMMFLPLLDDYNNRHLENGNTDAKIAILATIIVLGGLECCIVCGMTICLSNRSRQESRGVPVAVRMQPGATFVANQTVTPEAQDNQPQIVLLPDYREMDDPPPPYEAAVSGYQTLQDDMPPPYEGAAHGQWESYV